MYQVLFLDDDLTRCVHFNNRRKDAVQVHTAEDCIKQLAAQRWDEVHLDHDLGGEVMVDSSLPNTGMEVVRWIVANDPDIACIVIHTHNTVAAPIMVTDLSAAGYRVMRIPFGT